MRGWVYLRVRSMGHLIDDGRCLGLGGRGNLLINVG